MQTEKPEHTKVEEEEEEETTVPKRARLAPRANAIRLDSGDFFTHHHLHFPITDEERRTHVYIRIVIESAKSGVPLLVYERTLPIVCHYEESDNGVDRVRWYVGLPKEDFYPEAFEKLMQEPENTEMVDDPHLGKKFYYTSTAFKDHHVLNSITLEKRKGMDARPRLAYLLTDINLQVPALHGIDIERARYADTGKYKMTWDHPLAVDEKETKETCVWWPNFDIMYEPDEEKIEENYKDAVVSARVAGITFDKEVCADWKEAGSRYHEGALVW